MLLAICDAELLGETLREDKLVFVVRKDFYKGSKVGVDDAIALIQKSTIVNMIGPNIVENAIERGLVHPEAVLKISGVPHAQIVRM